MSVLFGIWNFDGKPADAQTIASADALLTAYAPDRQGHYNGDGIALSYHALHTTAESRREAQPFVSGLGTVLTWDGRLDNREELIRELGDPLVNQTTDLEIVAVAFDRWRTGCFAKLLGDWAVAMWDKRHRQIVLARDFAGVRPLYYSVEEKQVSWSSVIDPLVTLAGKHFRFNEEYAAGWLTMYPAAHTTPYVGINAVPPSSFVIISPDKTKVARYWEFDPGTSITYRNDTEYEEHFRNVFRQSVNRRMRADRSICCELSGGMDSPAITCMAHLIRQDSGSPLDIYSISFYDDSEPNADERPFFIKVEEALGRTGCHIDISHAKTFSFENSGFVASPGAMSSTLRGPSEIYSNFLQSKGIRVVLSGTGGDEMTGGVPSPSSELQDLMARGEFRQLAHKLKLWALAKRRPWFHLAAEAIGGFLPRSLMPQPKFMRPPVYLRSEFVLRHRKALSAFNNRVTFTGPLPSFQANLDALNVLRRQLGTQKLPTSYPYEKRYPFLDRTLLEFLFAIPREQLLLPGYRRSLLRRALKGIVPPKVLERRRKAYASRGPRVAITSEWEQLSSLCHGMLTARLGILDESSFIRALLESKNNDQSPIVQLIRTVVLEAWLQNASNQRILVEIGSGRIETVTHEASRLVGAQL